MTESWALLLCAGIVAGPAYVVNSRLVFPKKGLLHLYLKSQGRPAVVDLHFCCRFLLMCLLQLLLAHACNMLLVHMPTGATIIAASAAPCLEALPGPTVHVTARPEKVSSISGSTSCYLDLAGNSCCTCLATLNLRGHQQLSQQALPALSARSGGLANAPEVLLR